MTLPLDSDICVVYAHGNDWDGVPSRQRYLMDALSRYVPVIYLDGGWDRSWGVVTRHAVTERVTVIRGLLRPMVSMRLRNFELPSRVLGWWNTRWIRRKYRKIVFIDSENWLRPYRFIPHDCLIFDCIDPCFDRSAEVLRDFNQREEEVLSRAQLVFATAESLVEQASRFNPRVHLLNNACAPEEYTDALVACAPVPIWWPKAGGPIAAYLGSIDRRFDFELSLQAAIDHPDVCFILAGNILPEVSASAEPLRALPNVRLPGRISVEEGRYLLAHCNIGLIPFLPGEMNDAINPVKMYAYAFMGKAMAGSAVRELTLRPEIVDTGDTAERFSDAVGRALVRSQSVEHRNTLKAYAMQNTWEMRAETMWTIIHAYLAQE